MDLSRSPKPYGKPSAKQRRIDHERISLNGSFVTVELIERIKGNGPNFRVNVIDCGFIIYKRFFWNEDEMFARESYKCAISSILGGRYSMRENVNRNETEPPRFLVFDDR